MGKAEANSKQRVQKEWLDLRALTQYASVSARTIREWIHRTNNPLPAAQVGSKLLISRTAFNDWLAGHKVQPPQSVTAIVEDVMQRIRS